MVTSTPHTEALSSNIQSAEWSIILGAHILNEKESANLSEEVSPLVRTGTFRGRIVIEGNPLAVLEQDFYVSINGNLIKIEDLPEAPWPRFIIELITDRESDQLKVKRVAVDASTDSVEAAILSTRILYLIESSKRFSLQDLEGASLLSLQLHALPETIAKELISSAKLFRKLKYIEECFNVEFSIPNNITANDARLVEIIFRGITEGEFTTRGSQFVFEETVVKKSDLDSPPFSSKGEIQGRLSLSFITLFDKKLDVGSISIYLEQALLSDSSVIDKVNKNPSQPINVRFEVLDHHIHHSFERYVKQSKKQRRRRLELFKKKLSREEPQWLVDLIDESLQNDVSTDEALQIALGWRQYNDLPDRFCPQEPILDEANRCWRVPIYLVYANGEGGQVGEVTIDLKTGKIIQQTAIEEMFQAGRNIKDEDDSDALSRAVAKMINRTPEEIAEAQTRAIANCKPEHPLQPGQTIFDAVGGKWPGNESDQQIKEALERLS